MDNKTKLKLKFYLVDVIADVQIAFAKLCGMMQSAAIRGAEKSVNEERDIMEAMLKEDYPEHYKNELRYAIQQIEES